MTLRISKVFTYDEDAGNYIQAVEAADGQVLEGATRKAINNFVLGCKADGIWNAIKVSCILAGARTLNGALTPLRGLAQTNIGFVSSDYDRKTGLKGNKSNTINTNVSANAYGVNNNHALVYKSSEEATNFASYIGTGANFRIGRASSNYAYSNHSTTVSSILPIGLGTAGISRSESARYQCSSARNNVTLEVAVNSEQSGNVFVFGDGRATWYTDARLAFYSIGESLNLALLDARVTDLINAIGAAIP